MDLPPAVLLGIGSCVLAIVLALVALLEPGRLRLPASRRRPHAGDEGLFARSTTGLTARLETAMSGRQLDTHHAVLERAGVRVSLARIVLLMLAGGLACIGLTLAIAAVVPRFRAYDSRDPHP